jgi:signal peptide peptidase SppA
MKYAHIIAAVTEECWAIREDKLLAILEFLSLQANGVKFSAEEIAARIAPQTAAAVARREGAVAILPLRGVIANRATMFDEFSGGTSCEAFGKVFQAAVRDESVKAIILDVDSPGGMVSGSDELSSMIYAARGTKPLVAHVNANMASAAYWIGSACDEIVVTPSGAVGSIGVIGIRDDISKAMEIAGLKKNLIKAGKFKTDGYPFEPMGDDERKRYQVKVDARFEMFIGAIARNRGVSIDAVRTGFGEGDMVDAQPAVAAGMADRVATLEETVKRFGASTYQPAPAARSSRAAHVHRAQLREQIAH